MKKVICDISRKAHLYPMPLVVVGTMSKTGVIDWSTVAYVGIIDSNHLSIAVGSRHKTAINIHDVKKMSINIPSADDASIVDKAGTISGMTQDKSKLFPVFYGVDQSIPMIESFPLAIECSLTECMSSGGHDIFICSCDNVWIDEGRKLEADSINPLMFAWEAYYSVGERKGTPWQMNK